MTPNGKVDRRELTRVAIGATVWMDHPSGRRECAAVNASEYGVLVACPSSAAMSVGEAVILRTEGVAGPAEITAVIVRIDGGHGWVALRFTDGPHRIEERVRKGHPAAEGGARPRREVLVELRALGAMVYGRAAVDADGRPHEGLIGWADRLAAELGVAGVGHPADFRALLHAIARIAGTDEAPAPRPGAPRASRGSRAPGGPTRRLTRRSATARRRGSLSP